MFSTILGTIVPWSLVAVGGWFIQRLVRGQGILLERIEAMNQQLRRVGELVQRRQMKDSLTQFAFENLSQAPAPAPSHGGLTEGTEAPAFELPDLSGVERKLEDFKGRKLIIFFNPACGYCSQMMPDLAGLAVDGAGGRPLPILVAAGSSNAMRQLATEHLLRFPVLLDAKNEVIGRFKSSGTPTGYLVDANGKIGSTLAVGALELLALADEGSADETATETGGHVKTKGKVGRGLETSRLNRAGLKAGAVAPDFRLPKVGGGELGLEDLRGQRLLLVFSDPECGPCNAVAPKLEELHRSTPGLRLVVISRKGEEANQKKIAELGLTFPVVLQKSWEISKLYGIFETPVGYLINEAGVVVHDVARGGDAILGLLSLPTSAEIALPLIKAA